MSDDDRDDPNAIYSKIAGVSFDNEDGSHRQKIIKKCSVGESLILKREPNNPFSKDGTAIAVFRSTGEQLGHIGHDLSGSLAPRMDAGTIFHVTIAEITGGTWGKPTRGVNIKIETELRQFRIDGADKKTALDKTIIVAAESKAEAEKEAHRQKLYVATVTDIGPAPE
jgi:hypothetical protein